MSQEASKLHPTARAVLAITALVVIVVSGNMLVSSLGIGHKTLDLTEDRIHTLSDGTESILQELAAPVVIRYYASRSTDYMPEELKLHMRRVDDLLAEYVNLAPDDKLRVENLDPEPDTDAEDAANLDGISGQTINNENVYLGLAVSCLDRTTTIPFLNPSDETMLEYELSRAIAEVSATRKPTIGVMSGLDLAGGPPAMPGQRPSQSWVIYNQLQQSYDVEDLTMTPGTIDPERFTMVLLIHPAGITPEAEFALDQYLLQGGTVMACLDPFSITAQMQGGGNPMMGGGGPPVSSTLPTLLDSWGIEMSESEVVGDSRFLTPMRDGRPGVPILTVPQEEGMPQEDSIVTRDLTSVTLFFAGGMIPTGGSGLTVETLVRASSDSGLLNGMEASRLDPALARQLRPDDKTYSLVMHLKGKFKTAFPEGDPNASDEAGDDSATDDASTEDEGEKAASKHLTTGTETGNVFLISDVDAFYDQFAYRVQQLGNMQLAQPINGNSSLFFNLIDQATGSSHLIGSRSRAATSRPFTVFREMEAAANQAVGEKIEKFEAEARDAQQRLSELQAQKTRGSELYLSPEQEKEIQKLRQQQVDARREIRELEKDLRRQKDALAGTIITWNIAGVPALVTLVGLGLFTARRARTRAR